jgi:hypothetical protein
MVVEAKVMLVVVEAVVMPVVEPVVMVVARGVKSLGESGRRREREADHESKGDHDDQKAPLHGGSYLHDDSRVSGLDPWYALDPLQDELTQASWS